MTKIEWVKNPDGTQGETWNPVTGCDRVSPGCDNCYAERMALRLAGRFGYPADEPFRVTFHPDRLDQPLKWRKPRTVFVCSMGDLFHRDVPDGVIAHVFHTMAETPHTYQVLTKRPQRMAEWLRRWDDRTGDDDHDRPLPPLPEGPDAIRATYSSGRAHLFADMLDQWGEPPEGAAYPLYDWMGGPRFWLAPALNVWVGTSIESDRYAYRADHLRDTPAAVRFLSLEPLLGPLPSLDLTGIDWVIVGGESGPGARPMHPDWVREIRDLCIDEGVPFFFKQWGAWLPYKEWTAIGRPPRSSVVAVDYYSGEVSPLPCVGTQSRVVKVGKKAAGRVLDGETWDQMPEVIS